MSDRPVLNLHKEIANVGIVFGLVTAVGAGLALSAPHLAQLGVILAIAGLGLVGIKVAELIVIAIGELRRGTYEEDRD